MTGVWICVSSFSLCHLGLPKKEVYRSEGQSPGLCDKCFRGVGVEVRIKGNQQGPPALVQDCRGGASGPF